jgi:hypothetical protein
MEKWEKNKMKILKTTFSLSFFNVGAIFASIFFMIFYSCKNIQNMDNYYVLSIWLILNSICLLYLLIKEKYND